MNIKSSLVYATKITHNVYVTELVQPEIIHRCSGSHEVAHFKVLVDLCCGKIELVKDPSLNEGFVASRLGFVVNRSYT